MTFGQDLVLEIDREEDDEHAGEDEPRRSSSAVGAERIASAAEDAGA